MPQQYTPQKNYNNYVNDSFNKNNLHKLYVFDIKEKFINFFMFYVFNGEKYSNTEQYSSKSILASEFFSNEDYTIESKDKKFTSDTYLQLNDVINCFGQYYEDPLCPIEDKENTYLLPKVYRCLALESSILINFAGIDPNVDFSLDDDLSSFTNRSVPSKDIYSPLFSGPLNYVFTINTGLGKPTVFEDMNLFVEKRASKWISNKSFNKVDSFNNRLKLKVTGPSTANIGSIVEYTINLMNPNLTDIITTDKDIEVYPVVSAGILSHRKVILKNGTGKFNVDTTNLYSGDELEVKAGWKFITGDSKVTTLLT
jgi:hypothetical protein